MISLGYYYYIFNFGYFNLEIHNALVSHPNINLYSQWNRLQVIWLNCIKNNFKNDSEVINYSVLLNKVYIYGIVISDIVLKVQVYFTN